MDSGRRKIYKFGSRFGFVSILIFLLNSQSTVFGVSVEKDLLLTAAEQNVLVKFREKVSPLLYRDFMKSNLYLVRWLRAQYFDANAAEAMLRRSLKWRKERKIDTILEEDWSDMKADFYTSTDTYDKQGRPIFVMDAGDWNVRAGMLRGQGHRMLRYAEYILESVTMEVFEQQKRGLNVTQWSVLGSAEGFNVVLHACAICLPYWIQFTQTVESNYPGWMDKIIIIDAPTSISLVLQVVRPVMTPYTREALKVFGQNKSRWMKYLDEYIAKDQRTAQFGGTRPF